MKFKAVIIPAFILFSTFLSLLSNSEAKLHSGNVARERTARSIWVNGLTDDENQEFNQVLDTTEHYLDCAIKAVDEDQTLFRTWFRSWNALTVKRNLREMRWRVKALLYDYDTSSQTLEETLQ